jgi:segregation and condensation protein B
VTGNENGRPEPGRDEARDADARAEDRTDRIGDAEVGDASVNAAGDAEIDGGGVGEAGGQDSPTAFEEFAATWVPPWARALPGFVVEPAADYTPEELGLGRFGWLDDPEPVPESAPVEPEEPPNPDDFEPGMSDDELRGALEAILLVVDEPVGAITLAQVLEEPTARVESTLTALGDDYVTTSRGFELRQAAGGWRLYTRGEYAPYVERFVLDGQQIRLTQAALETLAVVAYKQPVTRSRISAIRGVNCDGVIKTLVTRGLVEECGTESESGAHLYQTTRLFLEKLGINTVHELPPLAPFLPTNVDEVDFAHR